jgi:hypothetical protein
MAHRREEDRMEEAFATRKIILRDRIELLLFFEVATPNDRSVNGQGLHKNGRP